MEARKFELGTIEFESSYQEVKISGSMHENQLSYPSELIINQKQLNCIINQLYATNENFDLQEKLNSFEYAPGCSIYNIDLSDVDSKLIELSLIEPFNSFIQICA